MWLEGVESAECLQSVELLDYFVSLPSVHLVFSLLIKPFFLFRHNFVKPTKPFDLRAKIPLGNDCCCIIPVATTNLNY